MEEQPGTASVVTELSGFEWKDQDWMAGRKKHDLKKEAMAVYEMHLASWKKKENGDEIRRTTFPRTQSQAFPGISL